MQDLAVPSGDVTLAVREHAAESATTVVAVHGYPDTQDMWDPVVTALTEEHGLRVVTYDVRGAGSSTAPAERDAYRIERLIDDLVAVLDGTTAGPVHLLGHDWGSVQLWDAVTTADVDPRLRGRIASFTSMSGPGLDHVAEFGRRARRRGRRGAGLRQLRRSWYAYAFRLPMLPELVWRRAGGRIRSRLEQVEGVTHWAPTMTQDGVHGLAMYRANLPRRLRQRRPGRTDVPVLLIVATRDHFVTPDLLDVVTDFCTDLRRAEVDASHWLPRTDPTRVADLVAEHVRRSTRP